MEGELVGLIPPYNQEAERAVLGAMMLDGAAINVAMEILRAEDFFMKAHGTIFEAMVRMYTQGRPVDLVLLVEELERMSMLEAVGGMAYIADITGTVMTGSNIEHYCRVVKDKSLLRALIRGADDIREAAYKDEDPVKSIIELAEQVVFDIGQDTHHEGLTHIGEVLYRAYNILTERSKKKGQLTGLTTGFKDLDHMLSGLQKSDLVLLAARPSMGKTALMLNIAQNAAIKGNASVAVFSLEMSKEQLVQRFISSLSLMDLQRIINADLEPHEWNDMAEAITILSKQDIYIDDTAGITPTELKAKCRRLKAEKGLDLIVIDYLQLMETDGRTENRQQEITKISRQLKGIAKELDVPLLALSQLSRAPEQRTDHRPIMSDLRESGAIEQDADIVMMLYRDEFYHPETELPGVGELILTKHRNGPTGKVYLTFLGSMTKFADYEGTIGEFND